MMNGIRLAGRRLRTKGRDFVDLMVRSRAQWDPQMQTRQIPATSSGGAAAAPRATTKKDLKRHAGATLAAGLLLGLLLTAAPVAAQSISGTVFQDTQGELLADGAIGSAANPALPGRTVRLFNASGTQIGTTTTSATGAYTLAAAAAGTYYVSVDAPTTNAAGNNVNILLEQTYAAAGTGNGGSAGGTAGYGALCVGAQPGYTQQGGTTTGNTASGAGTVACYGGRRGAVGDLATTNLNNQEHVTRVIRTGATNITGVDYGFSPYVVTNVEASGQGSLLQFSRNYANAAAGGTYTLRVVPAVPTNASGGGGAWWNVDIPSLDGSSNGLSSVAGRVVHFNGTPNSNTSGTAALNPNPGDMVAASTAVGNQGSLLGSIPRPDFAVRYTGTASANGVIILLSAGANGSSVRNLGLRSLNAISSFISGNAGELTVQSNVFGHLPSGLPEGAGTSSAVLLNTTAYNGPIVLSGNYVAAVNYGFATRVQAPGTADGYLIERNYLTNIAAIGISLEGNNTLARYNHVSLSGAGISDTLVIASSTGSNRIIENTVTANNRNLHFDKPLETVTRNVVTDATGSPNAGGAGVVAETSNGIRISQNTFDGNASNAIDLNRNGVTVATATGGNCPSSGAANAGMPRPRITSARRSGTTLTLDGFYCNTGTHTLEFYKAGSANGDTGGDGLAAGEGVQYLGALSGQSGGAFTNQTLSTSALAVGDLITVISIRADGSTSEFSANVEVSTAQLTLRKTWANAQLNDAVTVSVTNPAGVGTPLNAVAGAASETDTGIAFNVTGGVTYRIAESFTTGMAAQYARDLLCTGNTGTGAATTYTANALSGDVTIGATATSVICTFTNIRRITDLSIAKVAVSNPAITGGPATFTLTVTNNGPSAADGAMVNDPAVAGLDCLAAGLPAPTCSATPGASCPTSLTAAVLQAGASIPLLPSGGVITIGLTCNVTASGF